MNPGKHNTPECAGARMQEDFMVEGVGNKLLILSAILQHLVFLHILIAYGFFMIKYYIYSLGHFLVVAVLIGFLYHVP